ncbi:LytR/AlgR family response regulator transcription factor [Tenacibaculum sp. MEBiC06402]|uniref:LytR/AlgR family response regulator transcription factor n=1 Tax=unclassified Tenacibaculum TaxID=2635139 RepID=UPI003B9ADBDB
MTKGLAVIIVQVNNNIEVSQNQLLTLEQLQQLFPKDSNSQKQLSLDGLNQLYTQKAKVSEKVFLHVNDSHVCLEINSILKCEASGNYTVFFTHDSKKYLVSKPLKYYENLFNSHDFFRANRSVLVNMKFVKSVYKKQAIILTTNERIVVSSRNKNKLTEFIQKYT